MRGFRVWGLGISKIIILLFIFLYPIPYTLYPTFATDSSPSADIRAKLEELKKEIASKAAALKQIVDKKLKDKAYIGKVKTKSSTSLTLSTLSGPKIVSLNQDSILPKKKFAEEDYLAALGDVDETGVLTAKKIVLLPDIHSKIYLWGQIISASGNKATLKDRTLKSIAVSLPNQAIVKMTDFVILTGRKGKNDIFEAEFVYIIAKRASRSASPSALQRTF